MEDVTTGVGTAATIADDEPKLGVVRGRGCDFLGRSGKVPVDQGVVGSVVKIDAAIDTTTSSEGTFDIIGNSRMAYATGRASRVTEQHNLTGNECPGCWRVVNHYWIAVAKSCSGHFWLSPNLGRELVVEQ
jgi:hypothetical protein